MGFHRGSPNCTFPNRFGMHRGCWWRCRPLSRQQASSSLKEQRGQCPSTRDTLCRALTMASRHVVTVQPGFSVSPQSSTWHTGLLDCMSDCSVCICARLSHLRAVATLRHWSRRRRAARPRPRSSVRYKSGAGARSALLAPGV